MNPKAKQGGDAKAIFQEKLKDKADELKHEMAWHRCGKCEYRRSVPGSAHIACAMPDPSMTGRDHGIRNGWFRYPTNFDPTWKTKDCSNYKPKEKL